MSNHIEPQANGSSPFDAIKLTRPDGSEYWSARDLAPLMGYSTWQNFQTPLNRAMKSAEVQGVDVASNFMGSHKITATKPQEDFHLTRFAAYLTAMNGDPNKPEVAAAQSYFAIQTHVAEVQQSVIALPDRRALAQMVIEAEDRAELEAARADKAEHKAAILTDYKRANEAGDGIKLSDFRAKYFTSVPLMTFFQHLYSHKWIRDERGIRIDSNGKKKDGHNHMQPLRKANHFLYRHDHGNHGGKKRLRTHVQPQAEIQFRDRLIEEGLIPNTHSTGLVLFSHEDIKELSA